MEKIILTELSGEEIMEFLISKGVTTPDDYKKFTNVELGEGLREFVKNFEKYPDSPIVVNDKVLNNYLTKVKQAVTNYCGIAHSPLSPDYVLQDNEVAYGWDPNYKKYNCYSYAIDDNLHEDRTPGEFAHVNLGSDYTIKKVANCVQADLLSTNFTYTCVCTTRARPDPLSILSNQTVICARISLALPPLISKQDYHFMRLNQTDGKWYHKPANTAILRYKFLPEESVPWSNEGYGENGPYAPSRYYTGDIYYIVYPHMYYDVSQQWTGNHYHLGKRHFFEYSIHRKCRCCSIEVDCLVWKSVPCYGPPCPLILDKAKKR